MPTTHYLGLSLEISSAYITYRYLICFKLGIFKWICRGVFMGTTIHHKCLKSTHSFKTLAKVVKSIKWKGVIHIFETSIQCFCGFRKFWRLEMNCLAKIPVVKQTVALNRTKKWKWFTFEKWWRIASNWKMGNIKSIY